LVQTPNKREAKKNKMMGSILEKIQTMLSFDGLKAKEMLRKEARRKFSEKNTFLPDIRTSMMTGDESEFVISRAFQYIVALLEFNNVMLRFQMMKASRIV